MTVPDQKTFEFLVEGRVQGVAFRAFTRSEARTLGLQGFVENLEDGTVHGVVRGQAEPLRAFEQFLHRGSPFAKVETVRWVEVGGVEIPDGPFSVRH